jgi:hypothetical protein
LYTHFCVGHGGVTTVTQLQFVYKRLPRGYGILGRVEGKKDWLFGYHLGYTAQLKGITQFIG